jgi:ribosomal protein L5
MNNLETWNKNVIIKDLIYKKYFKNIFDFPYIKSICLKINNKKTIQNTQNIFLSFAVLEILTNQQPKVCFAKKSIAHFKIQKNMPLSCKITLRKKRKNSFLNLLLFFLFPKLEFNLKKNITSFNIGIKNLLFIPQLTLINHYHLNDCGFNIAFNFNTKDFHLFLSSIQVKQNNEKTKN